MAKLASQIVSMKSQLAASIAMFRFADTSDTLTASATMLSLNTPISPLANATFEERVYDASGTSSPTGAPNVGAVLTPLSAAPTVSAPTPSGSGGSLSQPCTIYTVTPCDSSTRPGRSAYAVYQFANSLTTNQTQIVVNWTGMTNVNKWYITKSVWTANGTVTSQCYYSTTIPAGSSFTITDTTPHIATTAPTYSAGVWTTYTGGVPFPAPVLASTVTGAPTLTASSSASGGTGIGHLVPVSVSARNNVGETPTSTVQWVNLGYTDLISSGPTPAATASTASGALAANTYYYKVSAYNAQGESLPGSEASATLSGTGNITVTWSTVPGATGYVVYRGTASNANFMVGTSGTTTFVDNGAVANSTIPAATQSGSGPTQTSSVAVSWSAVSGATSYKVRGPSGTAWYATTNWLASPTGTSYTILGSETAVSNAGMTANTTGGNVTRVAKQFQFDTSASNISKIGLVFQPVAGKSYRAGYNYTGTSMVWSPYVVAPSSSLQYMEFTPVASSNRMLSTSTFVVVEGQDATCLMGVAPINYPTANDSYGQFLVDQGTYLASGPTAIGNGVLGSINGDGGSVLVPPNVAFTVPMKIVRRVQNSTTQLTPLGTLSGLASQSNECMYSQVFTYSAPVKSFVPTWTSASGAITNLQGTVAYQNVEVSPDSGTTWYTLSNNVRFTFPIATTSVMFRFTISGNTQIQTWTPSTSAQPAPLMPASGTTLQTGTSTTYTADSGQSYLYYNPAAQSVDTVSGAPFGNGPGLQLNTNVTYSTYRSGHLFTQAIGTNDADITVTVDVTTGRSTCYAGPVARASTATSGYGYFLSYTSTGALNLYALNAQAATTLPTAIATVATGLSNARRNVRLVVAGSHIMGFIDGQLYIDITDSTITSGQYCGALGVGANIGNLSITTSTAPPLQMEQFSAYLEY